MEVHFFSDQGIYWEINLVVIIILMKIEKQFVNVNFGISLLFSKVFALRLVGFLDSSIPGHNKSHISVLRIKTLMGFGRCFLNYIVSLCALQFTLPFLKYLTLSEIRIDKLLV